MIRKIGRNDLAIMRSKTILAMLSIITLIFVVLLMAFAMSLSLGVAWCRGQGGRCQELFFRNTSVCSLSVES